MIVATYQHATILSVRNQSYNLPLILDRTSNANGI